MKPGPNLATPAAVPGIIAIAVAAFYFFSSFAVAILLYLGVVAGLVTWRWQCRQPLTLVKRLLLGAAVTIPVPCAIVFLWASLTGQYIDPGGVRHNVTGSVLDALYFAYLYCLLIGLPAFCVWSIACIGISLHQRYRGAK